MEQIPPPGDGRPRPNTDPESAAFTPPAPSRWTLDRIIRVLLGVSVLVATVWLIWYFAVLVLFLLVGIVLAYLMQPLVDRLQGVGLGRIPSILVTFVVVFGAIVVLITQLVPFAADQLADISRQIGFRGAAEVVAVDPASPADRGGMQAGDAIVEIGGQEWEGFAQLQSILLTRQPGDSLTVVVDDLHGERRAHVLRVDAPSRVAEREVVATEEDDQRYVPRLGLTVQEVTLSSVAASIERRVRTVIPVERGAIVRALANALNRILGEDQVTRIVGSIVGVFANIFYAILVIPFVAFFFLKDGTQIRHELLRLVPNRYFEPTVALVEKIETIIGRYFAALMIQIAAMATVASILLSVIGLKYAVAVGVFTGLANTIPYFGPLMGFLAGTTAGVIQTGDFSLVPGVIVAMLLTQAADNVIFQPYIFSRAARTHPLLILFAVLIGAHVAGIIGMLVAIPALTIVRVSIEQLLWSLRNYRILKTG